MKLRIKNESLFEYSSDAVILAIDGSHKGMAGKLARTFEELYPETWTFIESKIIYPVMAGNCVSIAIPVNDRFKVVFLAATLVHLPDMQNVSLKSIALHAYTAAIRSASLSKLMTIRCGLPTGGRRIDPLNAFLIISDILDKTHALTKEMELQLCILEEDVFESVRRFATNLGYKV